MSEATKQLEYWLNDEYFDDETKKELLARLVVSLGGRAAEDVVFGEISTGASNDISRATAIIKSMITDYGMSDRFKNVTLGKSGRGYGGPQEPELVREFSEDTQKYIDDEIARVMDERYRHVIAFLKGHRDLLEYVAKRLLEKETVDGKEFEEIIKAEGHCNELTAEAGKKADEERYINASALIEADEKTASKSAKKSSDSSDAPKQRRGRKPKSEEK